MAQKIKIYESRLRSIAKTVAWRFIAIINSFIILIITTTEDALLNSIYMNLTGFLLYYFFERVCSRIPYGIVEKNK